jgi:hypothetical protein
MKDIYVDRAYPEFRALYELLIAEGGEPMPLFGVMLGIMAQEFRSHTSKQEFENFLHYMADASWPPIADAPTTKGKPKLTVVQ